MDQRPWLQRLFLAALFVAPTTALTNDRVVAAETLLLDGRSGLSFPAGFSLSLETPSTLEFWVAALWQGRPDFDPCLLSLEGADGVRYAVHVQADRKAIGLFTEAGYAAVPFNFADGKLHSVTIVAYSTGLTEFVIDGESAGLVPLGPSGQPGDIFHLGSLDGKQTPFKGMLARLRLWDGLPGSDFGELQLRAQALPEDGNFSLALYGEPDENALLAEAALAMQNLPDDDTLLPSVTIPLDTQATSEER